MHVVLELLVVVLIIAAILAAFVAIVAWIMVRIICGPRRKDDHPDGPKD